MEIEFENRTINSYREIYHQTKRVQESAESVVPDTDDDIGKIASVQSSVMLKSKDVTGRGVLVSGEATASLLYITESRQAVSFVRLSRSFSIEYEIADISADSVAQISLSILNTEARVINPRKVSVTFEIAGELSCYRQETLSAETTLPENACRGLHARYESRELMLINAAAEKTFAVSEQFSFPPGKPAPSRIMAQRVEFGATDSQLIGSKIIIKGNADITLHYLSDEAEYPITADFSAPFSQIIDIGEESMDFCTAHAELTSAYFSLTDTINGDKMLDAEVHAVLQIVSRRRMQLSYISDVYSNLMPVKSQMESRQFNTAPELRKIKLSSDERIDVGPDCGDVLYIFPALAQLTQSDGGVGASAALDILYRESGGMLASIRKSVNLQGEGADAPLRIAEARLSDVYFRPDGEFIDAHISAEISSLSCAAISIDRVGAVSLDEQAECDMSQYPTVTLVRAEGETLWELAKKYHSSVDKISELNELDGDISGRLLLIPKAL